MTNTLIPIGLFRLTVPLSRILHRIVQGVSIGEVKVSSTNVISGGNIIDTKGHHVGRNQAFLSRISKFTLILNAFLVKPLFVQLCYSGAEILLMLRLQKVRSYSAIQRFHD